MYKEEEWLVTDFGLRQLNRYKQWLGREISLPCLCLTSLPFYTQKNPVCFALLWTEQVIYPRNLYQHPHLALSLPIFNQFAFTAVNNLVK